MSTWKLSLSSPLHTPASLLSSTRAIGPLGTSTPDWRVQLPALSGARVTLRELKLSDAPALLSTMSTEDVARFISEPPVSVQAFEHFICWTVRERSKGRYACFAVVPHGMASAVGVFQLRRLDAGFQTAEWGFALGSAFWGQGFFMDGAHMLVDFALNEVGVRRLEARSAAANGRGNGALLKIGAVKEGVLRRAFIKDGQQTDQALWSILAEDWRQRGTGWSSAIVH